MFEFADIMESVTQSARSQRMNKRAPEEIYEQMKEEIGTMYYLDRKKKISKLIFFMQVIKVVCFQIQRLSGNTEDDIFKQNNQQYEAQDVISTTERYSISQNDRLNYLSMLEQTNREYLNDESVDLIQYIKQSYQLKKYQKVSRDIKQNVYIQQFTKDISHFDKWEYSVNKFSENENYVM